MTTQPLDLEYIFVNSLAGSKEIFFLISMIFFAFVAAKFRMQNQIFLLLIAVYVIFMSFFYPAFLVLLIFLSGLFIYYVTSKLLT